MAPLKKDRYPGIKAFEVNESEIFFGREYEEKELYAQVKARKIVVLFAKSGIGKSSLINAGLIPRFRNQAYELIKVRLQNTDITPTETLKKEFEPYFDEASIPPYARQNVQELGLWEYLRACKFEKADNEEREKTPIIIFDQFEEFFNHKKVHRDPLVNVLSDLTNARLPEHIRQSLHEIPFAKREAADLKWHSPIDIKMLFAIRTDKLGQLDDLKESIPMILDSRFHLKALNRDHARDAIVEPAKLINDEYATPPFEIEEQALETILDFLSDKEGEIQSFSLQLICQHLEQQIVKKRP